MNNYLISLLRAVLNNTKPEAPASELDWEALYNLAQKHSVANLVCYAIELLDENDRPVAETLNKFMKARQLVVAREMMQQYEIQGMLESFEENGIDCIALKGWHMKHLYPKSEMRSMCDVDVLINEADMERLEPVMTKAGFRFTEHGQNHDTYEKGQVVSVEIHWKLFMNSSPYYKYFSDIMEKSEAAEGMNHIRKMKTEDFYLHLLAHAAKHFDGSGTGIRTIIDVWLYNKKYDSSFDKEYLETGLKQLGLRDFNIVMKELACAWFEPDMTDDNRNIHKKVGEYIMSAGTYGFISNNVVSGISGEKSRIVYLFKRVFPDRLFMSTEFPVLKKKAWLLPLCWIVRGYRCLFVRRHKFVNEMNVIKNADNSQLQAMANIKKLSGLK